ncbi:hypothetical protein Godav_006516 [Gossypium davidsonii]|uniref:Uncharacterized protein n=1 Tax=Gossypium davidsonii TaxID=34287 RepID=A0A7J8S411_GOSDV|nr:hypothetical protein [Gossypium davidsonii]
MVSKFGLLENLKIIRCHGLESMSISFYAKLLSFTIFDRPHLKSLHIIHGFFLSFICACSCKFSYLSCVCINA